MTKAKFVYVVWGPSPEWGDGLGVLGYSQSKEEAQEILEEERRNEQIYGPRSWRSAEEGYIEEIPVEKFLKYANKKARRIYVEGGISKLVEYLNENLWY